MAGKNDLDSSDKERMKEYHQSRKDLFQKNLVKSYEEKKRRESRDGKSRHR